MRLPQRRCGSAGYRQARYALEGNAASSMRSTSPSIFREHAPQNEGGIDVQIRIARQYARHARHIADALGQAPLCVVKGPRRFGKTTSLLPALATLLERRG